MPVNIEIVVPDEVRKVWHGQEFYYCLIDYVASLRCIDFGLAQNHYHVLTNRMQRNRKLIPDVLQFKVQAMDGKQRLTDFAPLRGLQTVYAEIHKNLENTQNRRFIRMGDEIENFHPIVAQVLRQMGYEVEMSVRLKSDCQIDMLARNERDFFVVECKPKLNRRKLYESVGQVVCYSSEYGLGGKPAIACISTYIDDYTFEICNRLGIWLIGIEDEHNLKEIR